MPIETGADRWLIGLGRAGLGKNHEVPRRQVALETEGLARQSLESVTVHGAFGGSTRDRQSEARDAATARSGEHREESIGGANGLGEDFAEFRRRVQALLIGERFARQRRAKPKPVTVSGEHDPSRDGSRVLCGRSRLPCARGIRASSHVSDCSAGMYASQDPPFGVSGFTPGR